MSELLPIFDARYAGLPSEYTGLVGTRCQPANAFYAPHKEAVSDRVVFIRDTVTAIKVVAGNWWIQSGTENSPAAATTFKVSVEYPVGSGTWYQATFSGASSAICAGGSNVVTDDIAVSIPSGAQIKVRIEQKSTGGVMFIEAYSPTNTQTVMGDRFRSVASGLPDYMAGGTFTSTDAQAHFSPLAVLGKTRRPTVGLIGDSRMFGQYDTCDSTGDWGEVARTIGQYFAYTNMAMPGERSDSFLAANTLRAGLINAYCSHVICEYGGADLNQSARTAAQIYGSVQSIEALFPGKTFFCTTSTPQTSSTDSWVTVANQTVLALETRRLAFNELIRTHPRYFDTCAGIEVDRTGKWQVSPNGAAYTGDGVHENIAGYLAIKSSGVINPSRITRSAASPFS